MYISEDNSLLYWYYYSVAHIEKHQKMYRLERYPGKFINLEIMFTLVP